MVVSRSFTVGRTYRPVRTARVKVSPAPRIRTITLVTCWSVEGFRHQARSTGCAVSWTSRRVRPADPIRRQFRHPRWPRRLRPSALISAQRMATTQSPSPASSPSRRRRRNAAVSSVSRITFSATSVGVPHSAGVGCRAMARSSAVVSFRRCRGSGWPSARPRECWSVRVAGTDESASVAGPRGSADHEGVLGQFFVERRGSRRPRGLVRGRRIAVVPANGRHVTTRAST